MLYKNGDCHKIFVSLCADVYVGDFFVLFCFVLFCFHYGRQKTIYSKFLIKFISFFCFSTAFFIKVIHKTKTYIHYLLFPDYCPHLCRHVYHNVSTVVRSGLLQVVGMSNLTLYFAYRGRLFLFHEPCLIDVSY